MVRPPNRNDPNSYYETLGVDPAASLVEIKHAYRMWARLYHPEGEQPDEERWLYIAHIYRVLSNPERRREYDESVGMYISEWEMQNALDSSEDLIPGLRIDDDSKPEKEPQEKSEPAKQAYSFWSLDGEEFEDLAQSWYPYFLSALGVFRVNMPVQVGVGRINRPHLVQVLPTKRIAFWVDPKTPPNGFTALSAVLDYVNG